jgi:SAM-dependent methyltransferase
VGFEVSADAYFRFIGRYSEQLAVEFAEWCGVDPGQRVLDVGCGPGALSAALVDRVGLADVAAVDPSTSFVSAVQTRIPGLDVRQANAEHLPFADDSFDAALAQLVVHFMTDPVGGIGEMRRVTRHGGVVGACVWDYATGQGPLGTFWRAVRELDPSADDESHLPGAREGHLVELFEQAGLSGVEGGALTVRVGYADFDDWWQPFLHGVGPAGAYVASRSPAQRDQLAARCAELLPDGPFEIDGLAWAARGRA